MVHIKKHIEEDSGYEYIDSTDVFDIPGYEECTKKGQTLYFFLENIVLPYLTYFQNHTSTAFGNPDYCRMEGKFYGYCLAKGWDIDETEDYIEIRSEKGRKLYLIEKTAIPQKELETRKEIKEVWEKLLG